jgi:hypothetical protein
MDWRVGAENVRVAEWSGVLNRTVQHAPTVCISLLHLTQPAKLRLIALPREALISEFDKKMADKKMKFGQK